MNQKPLFFSRKWIQIFFGVLLLSLLGFLILHFQLHRSFSRDNLDQLESFLRSFGVWAPIIFALVYYFATLFFLSVVVLTILGGLLFGKLWGSLLVIVVATFAAQSGFWLAQRYGSGIFDKVGKQGGVISQLVKKIETGVEQHGFRTFFVLRCLFLPYMPLSYAAGLVKTAKGRDFFLATLLSNAIFSPLFVFFGDALLQGPKALILPAILIVFVLFVPRFVRLLQRDNSLQKKL